MFIFGLDFTSAPSIRKPITVVQCTLQLSQSPLLCVEECLALSSFAQFEHLLQYDGPWLLACDFPFGQPLKLITNLGWPATWEGYVRHVAELGKGGFEKALQQYMQERPAGDKQHLRVVDRLANARSPMMLNRVPVAKMFFQGAPRLLAANVSVLPCRPTNADRIAVEGYPALVARHWTNDRGYKSDERKKQTLEQQHVRQAIVAGVRSERLLSLYNVKLGISDTLAEQMVLEPMGDRLDAVLCAIQAAWCYMHREQSYAIPSGHEVEGWIADPSLQG